MKFTLSSAKRRVYKHEEDRQILTRQERRERKSLRLKRAILNTLKRQLPGVALLVVLAFMFQVQPIYADTIFERVGQKFIDIFMGSLGRSIAILAIIVVGIGAATGRLTMEQVLVVIFGICLILGAVQLVTMFA